MRCYLVCYDICDAKRLSKVSTELESYGVRLQYSVFRCDLSDTDRVRLESTLSDLIKHSEDRILIIDLGVHSKRLDSAFKSFGVQSVEGSNDFGFRSL